MIGYANGLQFLTLTEQRKHHRLAGELHDYLGQLLVVARMKIQQGLPIESFH